MQQSNPHETGSVDMHGILVRELHRSEKTGFFIRVLTGGTVKPSFLDASKQPGHSTVVTTVQPAYHVSHPNSSIPNRYYPLGEFAEPVEPAAVVDAIIDLGDNEVAKLALSHLVPPLEPA